MPLWDWHHPLKLRRKDQVLRAELLLAMAELDVFTRALRAEIDQHEHGGTDHDTPPRPEHS